MEQRPTATRLVFSAHDPDSSARSKPHRAASRDYPGYLGLTLLDEFDPKPYGLREVSEWYPDAPHPSVRFHGEPLIPTAHTLLDRVTRGTSHTCYYYFDRLMLAVRTPDDPGGYTGLSARTIHDTAQTKAADLSARRVR
jgi:hypothetical protein